MSRAARYKRRVEKEKKKLYQIPKRQPNQMKREKKISKKTNENEI